MKRLLPIILALCVHSWAQTFSYNGTEPSTGSCAAATSCTVTLNQTIPAGHVLGIVAGLGASIGANNAAGINYVSTGCTPLYLANGDQFISTGYQDACYIYPTTNITTNFTVTFTASTTADVHLWDLGVTGITGTLVVDARQSIINESASSPFNGVTATLSGSNNYAIIQSAVTNGHAITAVSSPYSTHQSLNATQTGLSSAASINTNSGTAPSWTAASTEKTVVLMLSFGVPTTPCEASILFDGSGGSNGAPPTATTMLASTFGLPSAGVASNNSVWSFPAGTTQLSFSNGHYVSLFRPMRFCSAGATESNANPLTFLLTTDGTAGQYVAEMTLPQMPGFPGISIGRFTAASDWITTDTPNNDNGGWTDALNLYGVSGSSFSNASFEPNGVLPIWKLEGSGSTIGNIPATSSGVPQLVNIQYDTTVSGRSKLSVFAKTAGGNLYQLGNTVDKATTASSNYVEWLILGRNGGNGSPTTGLHFWHSNPHFCYAAAVNGSCNFPLLGNIPVTAQLSTGLLDPSRSIDWTAAGVTSMSNGSATLPSAAWTQSGSTIAAYGTSGSPQSCSTIATAYNAASANTFVLLGVGDFYLSAGCHLVNNNVSLRFSAGTTVHFADGTSCASFDTGFCFQGNTNDENSGVTQPGGAQACSWTAGYTQGTTSITLNSCGGTPPANGLLILDQANDTVAENGYFSCDVVGTCSTNAGSAGRVIAGVDWSQQQMVKIVSATTCGANCFTVVISPGLYATNWATGGKTPGAFWTGNLDLNVGIENVANGVATIDYSAASTSFKAGVVFQNSYNYWMSGIRSIGNETIRNHMWNNLSAHGLALSNYFYGTGSGSGTYCIENYETSDPLEANNIFQHCANDVINGAAQGLGYAYNYATDFYGSPAGVLGGTYFFHDAGGDHNLAEGNRTVQYTLDNVHGTGGLDLFFRNQVTGWEFGKTSLTNPFNANAYQREFSIIGNVLGTSTYHTVYWDDESAPTGNPYKAILLTGFSGAGESTSGSIPNDSQVMTSTDYWGNYDTVNAASRFNCWEGGTNGCPLNQTLPTSLAFSAKPAWYVDGISHTTIPWPLNGPDVTGGSDPTGHANLSPAGLCATGTAVDASRQVTYSITGASYNAGTQTETLTIGSNTFLQGDQITIAGASPGGVNGPQLVTASTGTTVSYGVTPNPGWTSGGTITWPNILAFNPNVCYGTGVTAPATSYSPTSLVFGNQVATTTSAPQTTTLTNTGTANLVTTGITLTGTNPSDFAISGGTCNPSGQTIAPAASCTVTATFTPASVASYTANLHFVSNAPNSPNDVGLSGTGISGGGQAATPVLSPSSGIVPQSVIATSASSGTIILCWAAAPTTPVTSGDGQRCNVGTALANGGTLVISTASTLNVVAGTSTLTDSAVANGVYTSASFGSYAPQVIAWQAPQSSDTTNFNTFVASVLPHLSGIGGSSSTATGSNLGNIYWSDIDDCSTTAPCAAEANYDWANIDTQLLAYINATVGSNGTFANGCAGGLRCKITLRIAPQQDSGSGVTKTPTYVMSHTYASSLSAPDQDVSFAAAWPGAISVTWPGTVPCTNITTGNDACIANTTSCTAYGVAVCGSPVGPPNASQNLSGFPVVYEVPIITAYQKFITAIFAHYSLTGSGNGPTIFPYVSSIAIGFAAGAENNPGNVGSGVASTTIPGPGGVLTHTFWPCPAGLAACPAAFNQCGYLYTWTGASTFGNSCPATLGGDGYVTAMDKFFATLNTHGITISQSSHGGPPSNTNTFTAVGNAPYADAEALLASIYGKPSGNFAGAGFGQQSERLSDMVNLAAGSATTQNWVLNFQRFAAPVHHLITINDGGANPHAAEFGIASINGITCTGGGPYLCTVHCTGSNGTSCEVFGDTSTVFITGNNNPNYNGFQLITCGGTCPSNTIQFTSTDNSGGSLGQLWSPSYLPLLLPFASQHQASYVGIWECDADYTYGVTTSNQACGGNPGPDANWDAAIRNFENGLPTSTSALKGTAACKGTCAVK